MPRQHIPHPCNQCPFRTDTRPGWLGRDRMVEITSADSFTCHKTHEPDRKQCAGHMMLLGQDNAFVRAAAAFGYDLGLTGRGKVFETVEECVEHHAND